MTTPVDHAALLTAVAEELARARRDMAGIEALVGRLAAHAPAEVRGQALTEAQAADALAQTLDALSIVVRRLGEGATPDGAVAALPLADLAARLGADAEPHASQPSSSGELLLF